MASARPRKAEKKTERLEARIPAEQKELIQRAAQIKGLSLTDFVLLSAQEAARETIKEHSLFLSLSTAGTAAFVNTVLHPPQANERLLQAARDYYRVLDELSDDE